MERRDTGSLRDNTGAADTDISPVWRDADGPDRRVTLWEGDEWLGEESRIKTAAWFVDGCEPLNGISDSIAVTASSQLSRRARSAVLDRVLVALEPVADEIVR